MVCTSTLAKSAGGSKEEHFLHDLHVTLRFSLFHPLLIIYFVKKHQWQLTFLQNTAQLALEWGGVFGVCGGGVCVGGCGGRAVEDPDAAATLGLGLHRRVCLLTVLDDS